MRGLATGIAGILLTVTLSAPAQSYRLEAGQRLVGDVQTVRAVHEDTLPDLARRYGVGHDEIRAANADVDPWLPGEGTVVRIPSRWILPEAPREGIVINLPEQRLYYFSEGGTRVVTHPVSIGREHLETPRGRMQVTVKVAHPTWYPPVSMRREAAARGEPPPTPVPAGPDNPLGAYALKLDRPGYLIHGTNRPYGIGMAVTRGCVRLYPEDIKSLFSAVPVGTSVRIVDQPVKQLEVDGHLWLEIHRPRDAPVPETGPGAWTTVLTAVRAWAGDDAARLSQIDEARLRRLFDAAEGVPVPLQALPEPLSSPSLADIKKAPTLTGGAVS
jgi:L,D-transpeptidase ErfK/SrfK